KVERAEIVVIILHFGTLTYGVADAAEDLDDALPHDRDRVQASGVAGELRGGEVDGWAFRSRFRSDRRLQLLDPLLGCFFEQVQPLAIRAFFLRRDLLEVIEQRGDRTVATEPGHA